MNRGKWKSLKLNNPSKADDDDDMYLKLLKGYLESTMHYDSVKNIYLGWRHLRF